MKSDFHSYWVYLLSTVLLTLFATTDTAARPEFAAQEDKECTFCHIDPAGGGPRNEIGQVFEDNYFEFPEDFDAEAIMAEAETVAKRLRTAIDIRTAYIKTNDVDHSDRARANCNSCHSAIDSFYMMQGELTLNAQASEKVRLTLSNNMGSTLNMFATIDAVPGHLYVKVGQFRIPFGIKQKDHNMLVRQGYDLGSNKRDVGVEVGGSAGKVFYSAAIFNGGRALRSDTNQHKAWTSTIGSSFGQVRGGVSYLVDKPRDERNMVAGAFLTAVHKGLSIEAEVNIGNSFADDESLLGDLGAASLGYYAGARYRVIPKLILSGRYEAFDPDRDRNGDELRRISGSARYTVTDNATLELYYWGNIANKDRAPDAKDRQLAGIDQIILMSHFWY